MTGPSYTHAYMHTGRYTDTEKSKKQMKFMIVVFLQFSGRSHAQPPESHPQHFTNLTPNIPNLPPNLLNFTSRGFHKISELQENPDIGIFTIWGLSHPQTPRISPPTFQISPPTSGISPPVVSRKSVKCKKIIIFLFGLFGVYLIPNLPNLTPNISNLTPNLSISTPVISMNSVIYMKFVIFVFLPFWVDLTPNRSNLTPVISIKSVNCKKLVIFAILGPRL